MPRLLVSILLAEAVMAGSELIYWKNLDILKAGDRVGVVQANQAVPAALN
jgi:hypothetical protein